MARSQASNKVRVCWLLAASAHTQQPIKRARARASEMSLQMACALSCWLTGGGGRRRHSSPSMSEFYISSYRTRLATRARARAPQTGQLGAAQRKPSDARGKILLDLGRLARRLDLDLVSAAKTNWPRRAEPNSRANWRNEPTRAASSGQIGRRRSRLEFLQRDGGRKITVSPA